ncbi:MAG: hypothetical protein AAGF24_03790 [Cyanobacteria bacterium P01_H01_bin.121]
MTSTTPADQSHRAEFYYILAARHFRTLEQRLTDLETAIATYQEQLDQDAQLLTSQVLAQMDHVLTRLERSARAANLKTATELLALRQTAVALEQALTLLNTGIADARSMQVPQVRRIWFQHLALLQEHHEATLQELGGQQRTLDQVLAVQTDHIQHLLQQRGQLYDTTLLRVRRELEQLFVYARATSLNTLKQMMVQLVEQKASGLDLGDLLLRTGLQTATRPALEPEVQHQNGSGDRPELSRAHAPASGMVDVGLKPTSTDPTNPNAQILPSSTPTQRSAPAAATPAIAATGDTGSMAEATDPKVTAEPAIKVVEPDSQALDTIALENTAISPEAVANDLKVLTEIVAASHNATL